MRSRPPVLQPPKPSLSGTTEGEAASLANKQSHATRIQHDEQALFHALGCTGPANGTSLRALYAWCVALADRAAAASARRGLSYQPPGRPQLQHHSDHYFGEVLFLFASICTCNGYDFRGRDALRKKAPVLPTGPLSLCRPEAPGDCSSPVPCLFACTQFSDWSSLWRQPPPARSFPSAVRARQQVLGWGSFDCKSHAGPRPPPFSDPGKGPVGRKVPPAISAGRRPLGSAATRPIVADWDRVSFK